MQASASKKTLFATEQDRPDVARRRLPWKAYQGRFDPARLVFIDRLGQDKHDTVARLGAVRAKALGQGAAGALANADLPGSIALRPDRRSLRHRRADQRR